MSKVDIGTIEKFQIALQKDPNSQVFATLAEAYREMQMLKEAEAVVRNGMWRHPNFVGGLVTFAKIMRDLGKFQEALPPLKKAAQLSPDNILAHQLMAEVFLANKQPKEALKAYKMVLFLNPNSKIAHNAVSKLESLTADDYDDEVFEMSKLQNVQIDRFTKSATKPENENTAKSAASEASPRALERMLSLIDAFIVRNDLEKAHLLLKDTLIEFGDHPEIQRRMKSLQIRTNHDPDAASPLKPMGATGIHREKMQQERNIKTLHRVLENITHYREMTSRV